MALTRLPAPIARPRLLTPLRRRAAPSLIPRQQKRYSSPFFALGRLSTARETQHLNKLSKLNRVEHSPPLELIRSSEVEPFASGEAKRGVESGAGVGGAGGGVGGVGGEGKGLKTPDERTEAWSEGGRRKSLVELAEEWRERQRLAAASADSGEAAGSSTASAAAGSSGDNGGKSPKSDGVVIEQNDEITDEEVLKVGRSSLNGQVQDKHKLRKRVLDMKEKLELIQAEVKESRDKVEARATQRQRIRGAVFVFFGFFMFVGGGVLGYLASQADAFGANDDNVKALALNKRASKLEAAEKMLGEMEKEKKQDQQKAREDFRRLRENHGTEMAALRSEMKEATAKAKQNEDAQQAIIVAEGKVLTEQLDRSKAHEAKMADWTKKAEELKRAVERKDVQHLSKAEQDAYLEALVFLRVRQRKERSWLSGLFWREE